MQMLRHPAPSRNHPPDASLDVSSARPLSSPSIAVVIACLVWSAALALVSVFLENPWNAIAFNLAAWLPLAVLVVPLIRARVATEWLLMVAGIVCFAVAGAVESVARQRGTALPEQAGISDIVFLTGYGLLGTGVIRLVSTRARRTVREGLGDLAVLLVPVTVLILEFVVLPGTGDSYGWALRLLAALYPLLDILLLAAMLWLLATPTTSGPWLRPMLLGFLLSAVATMLVAADLLQHTSIPRRLVEASYPFTWTLLAVGIAMGVAARPRTGAKSYIQWGRVALLALGVILGPTAVALAAIGPHPLPTAGVAIAATLSAVFIVARTIPIVVQLERTTERLDSAQQQLREAATHDPLTGLLNRAFLSEMLASPAKHGYQRMALVSLDLDGFKEVNDTLGHAAGDRVLKVVAERIKEMTRPDDEVVRMGGDEFLVVAYGVGESEMTPLMERLLERVSEPIAFNGSTATVSASAGIAVLEPEATAEELSMALTSSDEAMYAAKRSGPGRIVVHHP